MRFTIHQPQLFAPIYLWARFASVEKLVLLSTDWMKKEGWHGRFKILTKNGPVIITAPIRGRSTHRINEATFDDPLRFFGKLHETLYQTYRRAPFFGPVMQSISKAGWDTYGRCAVDTTREIATYLQLPLEITDVLALGMGRPDSASEWLAQIGHLVGGTEYVCAADAQEKYLDVRPFHEYKIRVVPQQWTMTPYHQQTDATVSILDLLFHHAPGKVKELLIHDDSRAPFHRNQTDL